MIFERKKNWALVKLCHIVVGPQFLKYYLSKLPNYGGTRPQKMLHVTLKSPQNFFAFNIFKGCTWGKMCSLVCIKAKSEEKVKQIVFAFTMCKVNVAQCPFWGPTKHIKPKWIPNFLLGNCSWSKMKVFAKFQKIH